MAARIAWLLNLDADLELREPASYRAGTLTAERLHELATRVADLIAPEDIVLDGLDSPEAAARACRDAGEDVFVQAFCPTPSALARIAQLGLAAPPAPPLAVLRAVNDRAFCAQLGHGLADSCFARDMQALEQHLARSPAGTYVIKRAFSFAGREQRRVHVAQGAAPRALDASTRGFCLRSFERGEGVQVEPWVERRGDFSRHGYLTRSGALLVGPTRAQECDAMGRFQRMSTAPAAVAEHEDALLASTLQATGAALAHAGYFGPFGIDGFRYVQPDGSTAFNPRCEINARLTMGYPRALLLRGLLATV